ncbi:MAG: cytochrome c [Chitinophagaceae bacterium]
MKKIYVSSLIVVMALFLSYCHSAKKASAPATASVTFVTNIQPIIVGSCAPCHVPSQGGNKAPYEKYDVAKKDIDDILRRIQLNPDERGFMPARHPKLSDATISVFKQWKDGGLVEK